MAARRRKKRAPPPRSYGQYCGLARALDVIGDRWTLLIVRELLLQGPCRYTDLKRGLPGIATNLLAARLRQLEQAGVIQRQEAPPPVATALIRLTPRGEELRAVTAAIGRWGGALLADYDPGDAFQTHWLAMPIELHLKDRRPERPPIRIEVLTGDEPMVIEAAAGAIRTHAGRADHPDAVLTGPPNLVASVLMGKLTVAEATRLGLTYDGARATLARVRP